MVLWWTQRLRLCRMRLSHLVMHQRTENVMYMSHQKHCRQFEEATRWISNVMLLPRATLLLLHCTSTTSCDPFAQPTFVLTLPPSLPHTPLQTTSSQPSSSTRFALTLSSFSTLQHLRPVFALRCTTVYGPRRVTVKPYPWTLCLRRRSPDG